MSSGKAADIFPFKSMFSAPCVISKNFPWDCFPGTRKPMMGSYDYAVLSRPWCNFQLISCAPAIQSGLDLQAAEVSHAGMLMSGSVKDSAQVSCNSSGSGHRPGGLQKLCHSTSNFHFADQFCSPPDPHFHLDAWRLLML